MPIEAATFLNDLVATNPIAGDPVAEGDDHIRLMKTVLKNTFPGLTAAVTLAPTATPQFAGINIGHATDTTLARASAGNLSIEGNLIYRAGGTDVPIADGGTGASTAGAARVALDVPGLNDSNVFTNTQKFRSLDGSASAAPNILLERFSPTPAAADALGNIQMMGYNAALAEVTYAGIRATLVDPTTGAEDGAWRFSTLVNSVFDSRMQLEFGLYMAGSVGTDQGNGTINAKAVYDDGVLVCFVPEEARTGTFDRAAWSKLAPHGSIEVHEALKAKGFNPQSAQSYAQEARAHGALPGYWNKDEWAARQVQTKKDHKGRNIVARVSLAERHERTLLALDYMMSAVVDLVDRNAELERRIEALENR